MRKLNTEYLQAGSEAKGFTLIELIVTMVLVAILVTAGIPGMRTLLETWDTRSDADKLASAIGFARQEAVSRVNPVTICASSNASANNPTCGAVGDWATGWIIFTDLNSNNIFDAGETLLRVTDLAGSDTTFLASAALIRYQHQGENDNNVNVSFNVCGPAQDIAEGRQVSVSRIGSVSKGAIPTGESCS